jgi:uncharacterized protein with von Willebrand factor type A (vWA) domain
MSSQRPPPPQGLAALPPQGLAALPPQGALLAPHGSPLLTPLLRLTHSLREAGVPVSASEVIDAAVALEAVEVVDRGHVRGALAATLVKRAEDRAAFDTLFELHFAIRLGRRGHTSDAAEPGRGALTDAGRHEVSTSLDRDEEAARGLADASTELLEALLDALRRGDGERLRELADMAVVRYGGIGSQADATERYFLHRVMRALELSRLMAEALKGARQEDAAGELDERRFRAELAERIEAFKRLLAEQVRAHMAELRGAADAAQAISHLAIEETDFLGASPRQLALMREEIRPLARALATRMARRRRRRNQGRLDIRRTVRRSLGSGGVPIDPVFRRPRVARPDLYLLCDVSGSVAEFASFTLTLLQAMTGEFPRMRSFAFVDGVDEVSDHLKDVASFLEVSHVLYRADVVAGDGHSDYGAVLQRFSDRFGTALDSRSTLIITGDARSNMRAPRAELLRALHARARRVYLLNPEPAAEWDTADSIVSVYAPYLDGVFEVRNLEQLAAAVLRIS